MSVPTITAIVPTRRDAQRATVKVDGQALVTLSQKRIAQLGVAVGQVWNDALAEQVEAAAMFDKALMAAMNGLSRRAMSRAEVDRKLTRQGHDPAVREAVLERLVELSLLDDEAFGRALIRDVQGRAPAGPRLLKQKLAQKGLEAALIERLVSEATADHDDQFDAALTFARKRLTRLTGLEARTQRRRLYGQLARRGFTGDTIEQVMQTIATESADADEAEASEPANDLADPE